MASELESDGSAFVDTLLLDQSKEHSVLLWKVAQEFDETHYCTSLATHLLVKGPQVVRSLEAENTRRPQSIARRVLEKWVRENPGECTVGKLASVLDTIGLNSVAKDLRSEADQLRRGEVHRKSNFGPVDFVFVLLICLGRRLCSLFGPGVSR